MNYKVVFFLAAILFVLAWRSPCLASDQKMTPIPDPFSLSSEELGDTLSRADAGDTKAQIRLFKYYDVIRQDAVTSIKWLRKAADAGDPEAEYTLGVVYESGGPLENPELARYWLDLAAKHGYVPPRPNFR